MEKVKYMVGNARSMNPLTYKTYKEAHAAKMHLQNYFKGSKFHVYKVEKVIE